MKAKKVRNKIFIALIFLIIGVIGSKFYYAKNYVLIERTVAETIPKKEASIEDQYILIDKNQFGQFTTFFEAYKELSENYIEKIDTKKLVDGAISGMAQATGDIHTSFTPIDENQESVENALHSSYKGIGAEVTLIDGYAVITNPYKNAPAYQSGVMPYDRIIKVDGEDVVGEELSEIVSKIKGEKGTKVVVTLQRGSLEPFDVTITRDEIIIETVFYEVVEKDGKKIGMIEIASFAEETAKDFQKALKELEKEKISGLMIDVRDNGGGYLQAVSKIASDLLPSGEVILQMENKEGDKNEVHSGGFLKSKKKYPIVVLVNGNSASASEVLTAALKESAGYKVIGEKTYGKGTVQELSPLSDNSELKVTVAKWLTPKGKWVHEKGIVPDIEVVQPRIFTVPGMKAENEPAKLGDVSNDILYAQELLNVIGYTLDETKGYFGEETEKIVREYQLDEELEETGVLDKETVFSLNQKLLEIRKDKKYDEQFKQALESILQN